MINPLTRRLTKTAMDCDLFFLKIFIFSNLQMQVYFQSIIISQVIYFYKGIYLFYLLEKYGNK